MEVTIDEITIPVVEQTKVSFAVLSLIKSSYKNFFVIKHEHRSNLEDLKEIAEGKVINTKQENLNVGGFPFLYWKIPKVCKIRKCNKVSYLQV